MKIYGYVRVSSRDQNEDRQLEAIFENGIEKNNIYIDKESSKDFMRTKYMKLMKRIKSGDCIVVKSIDRFGRNYEEILEQWE